MAFKNIIDIDINSLFIGDIQKVGNITFVNIHTDNINRINTTFETPVVYAPRSIKEITSHYLNENKVMCSKKTYLSKISFDDVSHNYYLNIFKEKMDLLEARLKEYIYINSIEITGRQMTPYEIDIAFNSIVESSDNYPLTMKIRITNGRHNSDFFYMDNDFNKKVLFFDDRTSNHQRLDVRVSNFRYTIPRSIYCTLVLELKALVYKKGRFLCRFRLVQCNIKPPPPSFEPQSYNLDTSMFTNQSVKSKIIELNERNQSIYKSPSVILSDCGVCSSIYL